MSRRRTTELMLHLRLHFKWNKRLNVNVEKKIIQKIISETVNLHLYTFIDSQKTKQTQWAANSNGISIGLSYAHIKFMIFLNKTDHPEFYSLINCSIQQQSMAVAIRFIESFSSLLVLHEIKVKCSLE